MKAWHDILRNMDKFSADVNDTYKELYNLGADDETYFMQHMGGYDYLELFNRSLLNKDFSNVLKAFIEYRGDFVSSDREAVAFLVTVAQIIQIDEQQSYEPMKYFMNLKEKVHAHRTACEKQKTA